jgi:YD repeat-containing protein
MSGRRTFLGNAAAAVVMTKISSLRSLVFAMEGLETNDPTMSDREKAEFRGPVGICIEERDWGEAGRLLSTTEYSPGGKLLATRTRHATGSEWVTTHRYDAQGRLIATTSGKSDEAGTEATYTYDEAGRLLTITNSPGMGCRIDFHYDRDEQRRKTSIQKFSPEVFKWYKQGVMVESAWTAAQAGIGIPLGGSVTTIYDDRDQQTELQIRDAEDRLVSRTVRTYDANGRLVEEELIQENPALYFAASFAAEGQPRPTAAQLEAMNKAMKSLLRGGGDTVTSYIYDAQGRVTEMRYRSFWFDKVTTTSYNEHGNKSAEHETITGNSAVPVGTAYSIDEEGTLIPHETVPNTPSVPEVRQPVVSEYSYKYDSYGNWTQQTVNYASGPDSSSYVYHRTITYY